jgi:hypothetical protein
MSRSAKEPKIHKSAIRWQSIAWGACVREGEVGLTGADRLEAVALEE